MTLPSESREKTFSEVLRAISRSVPAAGLTLRDLLEKLGDGGLLTFCMVLTIPFLLPVSIPGTSAPFGLVIALIAAGLLVNRPPWLPDRLMGRRLPAGNLAVALEKGAGLFSKLEKWVHPRWGVLSRSQIMQRFNGLIMIASAILLMAPAPLPFTNTLPAYGVLFLAIGSLEHDGFAILSGYLMVAACIVYFAIIGFFGLAGIRAVISSAGA